jgi:predicted ester cyclase
MSATTNKAVCRRHYEEVLTNKQLGVVDEIHADQIAHGDSQSMPREQFKMIAMASTIAFPDLRVTIHAQVAEGTIS